MKHNLFNEGQVHSFSRKIAKLYGVNAAIVLGYIGNRIENSRNERDGRLWFYDSFDALTEHYPYLCRSAIYEAIKCLTNKNGPLVVGHYNQRKGDRTNWYAFRNESTAKLLNTKLLYFRVIDAECYGVAAAVILNNLAYWITKGRKENPNYRCHPLSPAKLSTILPFSRSTIQRALKRLAEDEGVLLYRRTPDTSLATEYSFAVFEDMEDYLAGPTTNRAVLEDVPVNKEDSKILPAQTQIQHLPSSNPNKTGSDPNMSVSNPNDYTMLIDYCLKDPCLEEDCLKRNEPVFDQARCFKHTHTESTSKEDSDHKSNLPTLSIQAIGNDSERQGNNVNAALVKPAPIIDAAPILPSL